MTRMQQTRDLLLFVLFNFWAAHSNQIQDFHVFLVCISRLEGEGAFTNTQGLVWTGEFHGKAALGLTMQHNISAAPTL